MAGLKTLSLEADDYLRHLAEQEHAHASGRAPPPDIEALTAAHPALARAESFHELGELGDRSSPEARHAQRLQALVASTLLRQAAGPATQSVRTFERTTRVETSDEGMPLGEALVRAWVEPHRARREALGKAAERALLEHTEPYAQRLEAARRVAHTLGFTSPVALAEHLGRVKLLPLEDEARRMNRESEDAYRDLLAYLLRKVDPTLRPLPSGNAARHDLTFALAVPPSWGRFQTSPFVRALTRWLSDWGFHPTAGGRLHLDSEERPHKRVRPHVALIRVPDEIRVSVGASPDARQAWNILGALGEALSYASTSAELPLEERRLGDRAVSESWSALFSHLLTDARWIHRYLELSTSEAHKLARHFAFNALLRLRQTAAQLAYGRAVHELGPSRERAEDYVDALRNALFVDILPGRYLREVELDLPEAGRLVSLALETRLFEQLRAQFNEDFWRNPGAAAWLRARFADGRRENAGELAARLGLPPPSLPDAAKRLVEVASG